MSMQICQNLVVVPKFRALELVKPKSKPNYASMQDYTTQHKEKKTKQLIPAEPETK